MLVRRRRVLWLLALDVRQVAVDFGFIEFPAHAVPLDRLSLLTSRKYVGLFIREAGRHRSGFGDFVDREVFPEIRRAPRSITESPAKLRNSPINIYSLAIRIRTGSYVPSVVYSHEAGQRNCPFPYRRSKQWARTNA